MQKITLLVYAWLVHLSNALEEDATQRDCAGLLETCPSETITQRSASFVQRSASRGVLPLVREGPHGFTMLTPYRTTSPSFASLVVQMSFLVFSLGMVFLITVVLRERVPDEATKEKQRREEKQKAAGIRANDDFKIPSRAPHLAMIDAIPRKPQVKHDEHAEVDPCASQARDKGAPCSIALANRSSARNTPPQNPPYAARNAAPPVPMLQLPVPKKEPLTQSQRMALEGPLAWARIGSASSAESSEISSATSTSHSLAGQVLQQAGLGGSQKNDGTISFAKLPTGQLAQDGPCFRLPTSEFADRYQPPDARPISDRYLAARRDMQGEDHMFPDSIDQTVFFDNEKFCPEKPPQPDSEPPTQRAFPHWRQ